MIKLESILKWVERIKNGEKPKFRFKTDKKQGDDWVFCEVEKVDISSKSVQYKAIKRQNDKLPLVTDKAFNATFDWFQKTQDCLRGWTDDTTPGDPAEWKKKGLCPQCGDRGTWIQLSCVCTKGHGVFI